jgi:hypothetical protein
MAFVDESLPEGNAIGKIDLTMDRYTHVALFDQTAALDKLPGLPDAGPRKEAETILATGTDGTFAPRLDQTREFRCSLADNA